MIFIYHISHARSKFSYNSHNMVIMEIMIIRIMKNLFQAGYKEHSLHQNRVANSKQLDTFPTEFQKLACAGRRRVFTYFDTKM